MIGFHVTPTSIAFLSQDFASLPSLVEGESALDDLTSVSTSADISPNELYLRQRRYYMDIRSHPSEYEPHANQIPCFFHLNQMRHTPHCVYAHPTPRQIEAFDRVYPLQQQRCWFMEHTFSCPARNNCVFSHRQQGSYKAGHRKRLDEMPVPLNDFAPTPVQSRANRAHSPPARTVLDRPPSELSDIPGHPEWTQDDAAGRKPRPCIFYLHGEACARSCPADHIREHNLVRLLDVERLSDATPCPFEAAAKDCPRKLCKYHHVKERRRMS